MPTDEEISTSPSNLQRLATEKKQPKSSLFSISLAMEKKRRRNQYLLIKYAKGRTLWSRQIIIRRWMLIRVGRKQIHVDINMVKEIPLCRRTNIRSLARAMDMSTSTIFRRIKEGAIRPHTNAIKPHLTEENKKARLQFCLSMIESGKIGIFPFVFKEPAKRNSKNRVAGTLETKPILSVTKDVTRTCLIEKILPAIRSKWPLSQSNAPIFIQQDNARPHLSVNGLQFTEAARQDGFDIRFCFQPPNSLDLNVLDLGFFRAIQSLQHQMAPKTIDELVNAVEKSFNDIKVERLNHVFLTLQSCMVEVMKDKGGNNYKVPHMKKDMLERHGTLPTQVCCDIGIINETLALL
nr:uncharacterized protein LOC104087497 isoform X2 [Nicotiana tomentosiformis]